MNEAMTESIKDLRRIPGVGKSIAEDLYSLGYKNVSELKGVSPEKLYESLNTITGKIQDRCVLYVFRCAVYFASEEVHEPELLKWWNWKNREYPLKTGDFR